MLTPAFPISRTISILKVHSRLKAFCLSLHNVFQDGCTDKSLCYCPIIGEDCEDQRYSIPLHGLVSKFKHIGDHNRNYFFTVTVTNNANLITTHRIEVLVDVSSPQTGVVLEGKGVEFACRRCGTLFHAGYRHEVGLWAQRR